ncbi:MAG TPA: SRPBCC family protein [Ktedonobacterales bacterium]|nr:SRPBCC family protein [Ktedonobacterales bacterium]
MFTIKKSIVIDAPVAEVFAYVVDPEHAPEYYTDVNEVTNLRRLPTGGYACRFMPLDLTVETTEFVPNERLVARGTACGPMDEVTLTTTFERFAGDHGEQARVTCHEEHRFRGGFFGRLGEKPAAQYFDRAAEMTLTALKARIESGVPAKTPTKTPTKTPAGTHS